MKYYNRIFSLLLTLVLLVGILGACGRKLTLSEYPLTIEGSIFGGRENDAIATKVSFAPEWLTAGDNTLYNKDLASFAAVLCADSYFRAKDLDKGVQNRVVYEGEDVAAYTQTAFLEKLGFGDSAYLETYKLMSVESDVNDSATLVLGHGIFDKKDVYIVVLRGCFSSGEWKSVFDPAYVAVADEHPEWADRTVYKGYDVAYVRAGQFVDDFMAQYDDPTRENVVLITGHSRGGALADLLGARMEERDDVKSFTYTFNAPVFTVNADKEYRTIFNILDKADLFRDIYPFGEEAAYRYGNDLMVPTADFAEVKAAIETLVGRNDYLCLSEEASEEYRGLFGQCFPNWASLGEWRVNEEIFASFAEAQDYYGNIVAYITADGGLGIEDLCVLHEPELTDDGNYRVVLEYSGLAVMNCLGQTLAYGEVAAVASCELFSDDETLCSLFNFLLNHALEINCGHRLANTYVICQFVK